MKGSTVTQGLVMTGKKLACWRESQRYPGHGKYDTGNTIYNDIRAAIKVASEKIIPYRWKGGRVCCFESLPQVMYQSPSIFVFVWGDISSVRKVVATQEEYAGRLSRPGKIVKKYYFLSESMLCECVWGGRGTVGLSVGRSVRSVGWSVYSERLQRGANMK